MTDRYAIGDWTSIWGSEPFLIHRLVLDLQSRCVIAGQDRYRTRRTPMSLADLAYVQQILHETFSINSSLGATSLLGRLKRGRGHANIARRVDAIPTNRVKCVIHRHRFN